MRVFVRSLKRLYSANRIDSERVTNLLNSGEIMQEEYDYIVA